MGSRVVISAHDLKTDYSLKGRLKGIILMWCIFLTIFGVTRLPNVQETLLNISENLRVEWVTSSVNFFINGLVYVFIPVIIGTILGLREKRSFKELRMYEEGIGFVGEEGERFAPYDKIQLSWGKFQQSFYVECKELEIKSYDYGFGEFSQPDVLEKNLRRYSDLGR